MRYPRRSRSSGFTLIELIVVVVIIGLLAVAIVPNIVGRVGDAQVAKAKHDISQLESALKMYRVDNFYYPSTQQGLQALVQKPSGDPPAKNWARKYVERLPKDPWGNEYQYLSPGTKGEYDIYTLGKDGRPGGEGEDADIGNWSLE